MQHGNLISLQTDSCDSSYGLRQSRGTRPQTKTQGSQVHDQVTRFKINVPQIVNEPLFEREYKTRSALRGDSTSKILEFSVLWTYTLVAE
jgi:hypothetical protein